MRGWSPVQRETTQNGTEQIEGSCVYNVSIVRQPGSVPVRQLQVRIGPGCAEIILNIRRNECQRDWPSMHGLSVALPLVNPVNAKSPAKREGHRCSIRMAPWAQPPGRPVLYTFPIGAPKKPCPCTREPKDFSQHVIPRSSHSFLARRLLFRLRSGRHVHQPEGRRSVLY